MALSESRRKQLDGIVQQLAAQNASQEDVRLIVDDFTKKYGGGVSAQKEQGQGIFSRIKTGVASDIQAFVDKAERAADLYGGKEQSLAEAAFQTGAAAVQTVARSAARPVVEAGISVGKALLPEEAEQKVKEGFEDVVGKVAQKAAPAVAGYKAMAKEFPRGTANLEAVTGLGEAALEFGGGGLGMKLGRKTLVQGAEKAVDVAGDVGASALRATNRAVKQ